MIAALYKAVVSTTYIAVDWGTTNRRVFLIDNGLLVATERDDHGAGAVKDFPEEVATMRRRFGEFPVLLAGMVGSNIGWHAVPYVPTPAGLEALATALVEVAPRVWIVPGVSHREDDIADVMRGEEVQLLGAAAAGMAPMDALLCQPGTHSKWATITGKRIAGFTTAMTGELFGLVRRYGLLAHLLRGEVRDGAAFRAGVVEGAKRDLGASLFGIRAASLLGLRDDTDAAAHASGLLVGAEVAARLAEAEHDVVHVVSDPLLGTLYCSAIDLFGRRAVLIDSTTAFVTGIDAIRKLAPWTI